MQTPLGHNGPMNAPTAVRRCPSSIARTSTSTPAPLRSAPAPRKSCKCARRLVGLNLCAALPPCRYPALLRRTHPTPHTPCNEPPHTPARPQCDLECPPHAHATAHLRLVQLRCPALARVRTHPSLHSTAPPTPDAEDAKGGVHLYAGREGIGTRLWRRPTSSVDMRTEGTVRLVCFRNRHTLPDESRRQGGIPCSSATDTERACVPRRRSMRAACTHGSPCLPIILPAAALFPFCSSSTSSFIRWCLIRIAGARSFMRTSTLLHFRCATQLSSVPRLCAQFFADWDVDEHRPSLSTTRFALPFVILALLFHPSSPFLRTPAVLSLHR
ncbi:hypothetical protein DFH09DRAFT_1372896 [Mycena vulgaris]|nr:hypothetical protein DFH09DRAFT_1372896 [Mycena vulgaris]